MSNDKSTPADGHGSLLCDLDQIPEGGALEIRLNGKPPVFVMLLRQGSEIRAYHNVCPHAGRPLNWAPDKFIFTPEGQVVCAAHGAVFEFESGECTQGPCPGTRLKSCEVAVREGRVYAIQP